MKKKNSNCCSITMGVMFFFLFSALAGPLLGSDNDGKLIIRSGLTGVAGYSHLHLDKSIRPNSLSSQHYEFGNDYFMKVGAMLSFQPSFFGEHFQLILDPTLSKYSWGNFQTQKIDSLTNAMDVDIETIEFPISLRYSPFSYTRKVQPFVRAGYSLSWIFENAAQFQSKIKSDVGDIVFFTSDFPFSKYQHNISLSVGSEFNFEYVDYIVEFVYQRGNGIDNVKNNESIRSLSNTTSYYLQLSVLF